MLATRRSPERRQAAKLAMLLPLYPRHGTLAELSEVQRIIDWMLPLSSEGQRRMSMDIEAFLEEHEKEDKNSINYLIAEYYIRRGHASGEAKGLAEGKAVGLLLGNVARSNSCWAYVSANFQRDCWKKSTRPIPLNSSASRSPSSMQTPPMTH